MSKKVLTDDEFWSLVDTYEYESKGKVRPAVNLIIEAYKEHNSKDVDQALCDYEGLTCGKKVSQFVKNQITTKLLFNRTQEEILSDICKEMALPFEEPTGYGASYVNLCSDVNNLRGKEWLNEVKGKISKTLLQEFKELIKQKNGGK